MLKDRFQKEGRTIDCPGNAPVLLDDDNLIWMVIAGSADIFLTEIKQGGASGRRTHLFRVEPGQLILGGNPTNCGGNFGLLAVGGPETQLCQVALTCFQTYLEEAPAQSQEMIQWIDAWINTLTKSLPMPRMPKNAIALEAGQRLQIQRGTCIKPAGGTLWIKQGRSGFRYLDQYEIPVNDSDQYVPLAGSAWIMAAEDMDTNALETLNYFKNPHFWKDFKCFQDFIIDGLRQFANVQMNLEKERLHKKAEADQNIFQNALHKIAETLEPETAANKEILDDPLMMALNTIGKQSGIVFRLPVDDPTGHDRLEAISRASRTRKRKVLLRGEWWRHDNGPLLSMTSDNKHPVALLSKTAKQYELYDPMDNAREPVTQRVAEMLVPFAYTFYRPFPERALNGYDLLKHGLFGCQKAFSMLFLMGILAALLGLITPVLTGIIFDSIIPEAAQNHLFQVCLILLAAAVAISAFEMTRGIALLRSESKMDASVQAGIMDRLVSLPAPFFRKFTAGDLAQRVLGINLIRQILSGVAVQAILAGLFSSFNFVLMFWYDWQLALITTGILFVSLLLVGIANYVQVRLQRQLFMIQGGISGMVLQFINGVAKLRVTGTEDRAFAVWSELFHRKKQIAFKSRTVANIVT